MFVYIIISTRLYDLLFKFDMARHFYAEQLLIILVQYFIRSTSNGTEACAHIDLLNYARVVLRRQIFLFSEITRPVDYLIRNCAPAAL